MRREFTVLRDGDVHDRESTVDVSDRVRAPRALNLPKRVPGLTPPAPVRPTVDDAAPRFSFGEAKEQAARDEKRTQARAEQRRQARAAVERFARPERGFD